MIEIPTASIRNAIACTNKRDVRLDGTTLNKNNYIQNKRKSV
ncbi:MAG: hypothetical protein ACI4MY_04370 [Christensenellales bacterium]